MLNICMCVDDNYYQYSLYSIKSLQLSNKSQCNLFIIYNGNINENIVNSYKKYENDLLNINIIEYNRELYKYHYFKFNKQNDNYISDTTYIRLLFTEIFPNIDKLLYLDCDTFITKDLSELYNTDINDYLLAGVHEFSLMIMAKNWKLSDYIRNDFKNYYNAGIMLYNLKKLRELNYIDYFYQFHINNNKILFADQDILNYCCKDKIKTLNVIYNYQYLIIHTNNNGYDNYKDNYDIYRKFYNLKYNSYEELEKNIVIYHFCGNKNIKALKQQLLEFITKHQ